MGKGVTQPHPFFTKDPKPPRNTYRDDRRQEHALAGKTKKDTAGRNKANYEMGVLFAFKSVYQ